MCVFVCIYVFVCTWGGGTRAHKGGGCQNLRTHCVNDPMRKSQNTHKICRCTSEYANRH